MLDFMYFPVLLAQEQNTFFDAVLKFVYIFGIFALVFVVPFLLGGVIARAVRMRGYEFKIGLILASLTLALLVLYRAWDWKEGKFRIPLGVDLKGGVILIYEIDTSGGATPGTQKGKEKDRDEAPDINMGDLVQALTNRINPSGTKEIVIRPYGDRQVEIIIPEVDAEEVKEIKRQIETAGSLEFRIVANSRDHKDIIALAEKQAEDPDPAQRIKKQVILGDKMVGFWAQAAKEKLRAADLTNSILRNSSTGAMLNLLDIGSPKSGKEKLEEFLSQHDIKNLDVLLAMDDDCNVTGDDLGVVAAGNDEYLNPCVNFRLRGDGARLFGVLTSENRPDENVTPPFYRHLGIMLDERLLSFPRLITTITDSGRITGDFTKDEVDFLVGILRAGRLPATLKKEPISENQIGSMLGDDTIQKGKVSMVVSLIAVLAFVALYYRFSGLVACCALLFNLVLIMAMMVLLNAPLTLPGLAGLVLTVGMSVDANVLIFERMREEIQRGAALRMAIRNGFGRATTTIVDANVTTLITAMVLYAIGTDQVRGFAVTLILGILMSMYTAIFCSRIVFDIAERRHWITQLKMMKLLGATHLDFISKRSMAIAGSLILIAVGLVAVGVRGQRIFDIDFTGGVSVTMVLEDSMSPDDVRSRLDLHFQNATPPVKCTVNTVSVEGRPENSVYKIDADLESANLLETSIQDTFRDSSGKSLLQSYVMNFGDLQQIVTPLRTPEITAPEAKPEATPEATPEVKPEAASTEPVKPAAAKQESADAPPQGDQPRADQEPPAKEPPAPEPPAPEPPAPEPPAPEPPAPEPPAPEPPAKEPISKRADLPSDNVLVLAGPAQDETAKVADESALPKDVDAKTQEETPPMEAELPTGKPVEKPAAPPEETPSAAKQKIDEVRTVARLTFGDEIKVDEINAPTLREKIKRAYNELHADQRPKSADTGELMDLTVPGLIVDTDDVFDWDQGSAASSSQWYVSLLAPEPEAQRILQQVKQDLADTPVFPSSSKIGGKVAGDTRSLAIAALVASLFGIVGYIWIRFQRVVFGVAAVVALVHDILITLGAIAISAYLAKPLGFLLVEEFKISLPIVAAFLTIIGYSLNDTIVVFDRIREVRGKSPDLTAEMINTSINQTLSRTLLTSLTTLIVVAILYAIGGSGIHGFAFALVIGVVVGTYSSIFIASPILLWMFNRNKALD